MIIDQWEPSSYGLFISGLILHVLFQGLRRQLKTHTKNEYLLSTKLSYISDLQNMLRPVYEKLNLHSLYLTVYSDASFISNKGKTVQLWYLIVLMEKFQRFSVLQFSSHKSKLVTRSSMAAETLAFVNVFDKSFFLRNDIQRIMGRKVPLLMLTNT